MDVQTVREIEDITQKRKVIFYRRPDGTYFFEEWYFSEEPLEMSWIPRPLAGIGIYDSIETALREAKGRIAWLQQIGLII